ncbi:MAG: response regulator [Magnetococcales bacterium]|nr:response regulator [Magnetococcales bacterium]
MITVLIVDDSLTSREQLKMILESDAAIQVVGMAVDGHDALAQLATCQPNLILMDIQMPGLDGIQTTREVLAHYPIPIVICSGVVGTEENFLSFQAIEMGAVAALAKPPGLGHTDFKTSAKEIIRMVKIMSEVPIICRGQSRFWPAKPRDLPPTKARTTLSSQVEKVGDGRRFKIVAMGASTGGPPVLKTILSKLKPTFPVPLVIVQHISLGFLDDMVRWLGQEVSLPIHIATHNQILKPGEVYFAPNDSHMSVNHGRVRLDSITPKEYGLRPAASYLFRSVAKNYGSQGVGLLLTGMGCDGSAELKLIRDAGGITFAQSRESCAVFGMPGEAIKRRAATHILAPEEIGVVLNMMAQQQGTGKK